MEKNKAEGLDVHIHVDAASGGFVAPFVNPQLLWDFRVPLVCSINVSGHKCTSSSSVFATSPQYTDISLTDGYAHPFYRKFVSVDR